MKNLGMAGLVLLGLFLTHCATQTIYPNGKMYSKNKSPSYKTSQPFFIHGIAQNQQKNSYDVCGQGNVPNKVVTKTTFVDGLLGAVTLGLYTPRTLEIYCE